MPNATPITRPSPEEMIKQIMKKIPVEDRKAFLEELAAEADPDPKPEPEPKPEPDPDVPPTDAELKDAMRNAAMNILVSGQEYTIGSRKLKRVDFDKLWDKLTAAPDVDPSGDGANLMDHTYVAEFLPR